MDRNLYYRVVRPVMPDLSAIELRDASTPTVFANKPALPILIEKLWHRAWFSIKLPFNRCDNQESRLLNLPLEMLLIIASQLPDASRASLALTCKALLSVLLDPGLTARLQLPSEQPSRFFTMPMSNPKNYQPSRWEFLNYLERDLGGEWKLCSECFILHPSRMFTKFQKFSVPWLREYYGARSSEYRSCRHENIHLSSRPAPIFAPVGIVDLCPCIKITLRKRNSLEAYLRQKVQNVPGNDRPVAADFWWHQCEHTYSGGAIKLEIKIGIFLYNGTEREHWFRQRLLNDRMNFWSAPPQIGKLGVIIRYRHTYPSRLREMPCERSPRLLCPHQSLDCAIGTLLDCRKTQHQEGTVCTWCKDIQYCLYCETKVLNLREVENMDGKDEIVTCSYDVERCLDDRLWSIQSVFPFARRQIPLSKLSPIVLT